MRSRKKAKRELLKDIIFIMFGVVIAIAMSSSGLLDEFIHLLRTDILASFVAGIFFTSAFTLAPASVALVHVAQEGSVGTVVFWGALGAMCGDLLLFFFIRDRFADDIIQSIRPSIARHFLKSFHFGFLKWLSPLLGALIIVSPLPDEFGLALLGMSKTKIALLMPLSFVMNILGIYSFIWFAHLL